MEENEILTTSQTQHEYDASEIQAERRQLREAGNRP